MLFAPLREEVIWNYFRILGVSSIMSGLTLNYEKSSLILWRKRENVLVNNLCGSLGCKFETNPIPYLGFPLGANHRRIKTWDPVILNAEGKLNGWKVMLLSRGGG